MISLKNLPNKQKGEKVIAVLHRHWIVPFKIILALTFAGILPPFFYLLLQTELSALFNGPIWAPFLILMGSFYYLGIWMFVFQEIIDYYLDMWIITNKRVLSIEQHGLFRRTFAELHLEHVVDVTSEIHGMAGTMLHFGDVHVQTAGEQARFHFKEVPRPERIRELVLKHADQKNALHRSERT